MDSNLSCIFGSGSKAGVIEINGQYPAAPIQVTEGALVHVKVNNNLFGAVAPTLHWHGFKMSNGYYWYVMLGAKMDGPMLVQNGAKVDGHFDILTFADCSPSVFGPSSRTHLGHGGHFDQRPSTLDLTHRPQPTCPNFILGMMGLLE